MSIVVTRKEAKRMGYARYFTGRPCKHDHTAERLTSNGSCCECNKINANRSYHTHREDNLKRQKEYRNSDKGKDAKKKRLERDRLANPELYKKKDAKKKNREEELRRKNLAISNGETTYVSTRSCENGHDPIRFTNDEKCKECQRLSSRSRYRTKIHNGHVMAYRDYVHRLNNPMTYHVVQYRHHLHELNVKAEELAIEEGRNRFISYTLCPRCNGAERYIVHRGCVACSHEFSKSAEKKAYDKKYSAENADYIRTRTKEYIRNNRDKVNERQRRWVEANKDKVRNIKRNYKTRRRIQEGNGVSSSDLTDWELTQDMVCFYCGNDCSSSYNIDHVFPLSKGGPHELVNLRIACPTCNVRKSAKDPIEFCDENGFYYCIEEILYIQSIIGDKQDNELL